MGCTEGGLACGNQGGALFAGGATYAKAKIARPDNSTFLFPTRSARVPMGTSRQAMRRG